MRTLLPILPATTLVAALVAPYVPGAGDEDALESFELHIRPVLVESCHDCHAGARPKSGLRLDSLEGLFAGGERGPAVVPGAPEESLLLRAIRWEDHDLAMPPRARLGASVVQDFERWIEAGAPVPDDFRSSPDDGAAVAGGFDLEARLAHWSYQPVRAVEPPAVADPASVANTVDAFVQARLEAAGVTPNERSDRATLLRRVTLDLTGLPPTPEELDAFLADDSPGAYERVVDRLLASPGYGEHWARHWLDLMRYAESRGHEFDYTIPNAWSYRDYVIRALQADVPYDRFVLEHLAGDLLEEPRPNQAGGWDESILGTGSWLFGEEVQSPVDIRGDQVERVANQVDVLSKAFLGQTVACARCHDHKFDAIPTEDYYALAGYALSSSRRQVRYESRAANARVAAALAAAEAEHAPAIARAHGAAWVAEADDVVAHLRLARAVALCPPEDYPALPHSGPGRPDLVVEDFERRDWGDWEVTGDAFGDGPIGRSDLPEYQGDVAPVGERFVNSHAPGRTDERTGALLSPAFVLERLHLRFRIGGGEHLGRAGVELHLLEADGSWKVVATRTAANANRMREVSWDLRAWQGRTARLRVFDEVTGGWGNVGVDHFVLSDDPEPEQVRRARELERRRQLLLARRAAEQGLDHQRARAALALLDAAAERRADPLHAFATGGEVPAPRAGGAEVPPVRLDDQVQRDAGVVADWGVLASGTERPRWRVDGPALGVAPRAVGELQLGPAPDRPVQRVVSLPGPHADASWDGLALAEEAEVLQLGRSWTQSGRTLRTHTFVVPDAPLWCLVDGSVDVFVEVDGHRLVNGPLHGASVRRSSDEGLRWLRQDLREYAGHRAHVELTARPDRGPGERPLALHAILASAEEPALPLDPDALARTLAGATDDAGAAALAERLRTAAAALRDGSLGPADARVADWLTRRPALLSAASRAALEEAFRPWQAARAAAAQGAVMTSGLAPALWEGSGVDEYVLVRGNHRAPAAPAPRRAPLGVAGTDQAPAGPGAGRLELARRIVSPENPFLARVQVNRVWHHLFGRGLVATVDNFGVLGEEPTHPELFDWLAAWYREQGFSTKRLVRLLVTSEAYRRSSDPRPDLADVDGANRLWHRAAVRRLTGEAIRDSILATTGVLDRRAFGPPVPLHLTDFLQGRGRPSESGPLDGEGRRSIYQAVRRNFPNPLFGVFDRPKPTTTVGRRTRSNVPAQALTLLNDPFVHEQAERWARRLIAEEPDPAARVERMFRVAYTRAPRAEELEAVLAFARAEAEHRRRDPGDASVWADVAHVLLNGKELTFVR